MVGKVLVDERLAFFVRRCPDRLDDVIGFAVGAVEEEILYKPLRYLASCWWVVSNADNG